MRSRTKLWSAGLSLLAACALAGCHSYHIETTVENRTGAPIQLLEVDYPSASFGADRLDDGADYHYRFQVRGSGTVNVQYTGVGGREVKINGPALDEGEQGQLQIVLKPDGKTDFIPKLNSQP